MSAIIYKINKYQNSIGLIDVLLYGGVDTDGGTNLVYLFLAKLLLSHRIMAWQSYDIQLDGPSLSCGFTTFLRCAYFH